MSNDQPNPFAPPSSPRAFDPPPSGPAPRSDSATPYPAPVPPGVGWQGQAQGPGQGGTPGWDPSRSAVPLGHVNGPEQPGAVDSWGRPVPQKAPKRGLSAAWIAPMLVLAVLAGAGGGWAAAELSDDPRPVTADLPVATERADGEPLTGVAAIAAQVLPSVVSIEVRGEQGQGTGSGFVLRDDGYILTNNHVVAAAADGGAEVAVLFSDGSELGAEIIGRTPDYDLAVIKVERTGLRALTLADSDLVVVGDPVVAIGAPLGLQGTVTTGIVSARNRPVSAGDVGETAFINAIQTDAAINPGNSGGPLVNLAGEVVGINSAIAQPPGSFQASGSIGLGFAIPSNQARRTAEEIIETGSATYPVIGVYLDQRYAGEGVRVAAEASEGQPPVSPGGPAERAGIQAGDVILSIDGRPVTEADELIVAIRAKAPGDSVTLTVRTGEDESREVRVVLSEASSGRE